MDAGQGFVDTLPVYAIMPNPSPQYVVAIKLSNELLQHLQSKGTSGMTITFGNQNIITVGNEQFSFRAPPEEHGVSDCYRQVDDEEGGTFTKVGVVKRKIFVTQKLREEDRKRVKTATETHENARLSHKSVLIDATGNQLMSKDGKRKTTSSISKPPPTVIKRNRIETSSTRPQLSSLSSLASKHTTVPSKLSSPKRPPPLRSQIIQMLALEGLTHEQIEAKCHMASKTALASTLQQVAKTKDDGLYYLKKEVYTEVDTNWPGFTPEDRARVIERRALALQPDSEKKKDSEESAEGLPVPEPSALEAKATGARYPSPLPRALAAVRERPKEEKVVPARLAPPTTTTTSTSSTTAKAEAAAAAAAAAKEAAAKEAAAAAAAKEAAAAAAKEAAAAAAKEKELKERERERERELVRERERAKERERERQRERERERERERDLREKEKEKEKEKERERGLAGGRESSSKQQHERSPKDPSPARSSASSSAASSPSGSPASQAQAGTGSSPGKAKEEVPPPSAPRNGEHKRKRAEQPSREYNGTSSSAKGPNISMNEYKRRRVEWEKNYKEYCDLHRKLKENARFFEELGGQLKKASDAEKTKLVQRISADYQKRISRVRQWKKRFTFLHAEVKKEKAALLALHPHPS